MLFEPVLNLSSLNGNNGFAINGIAEGDRSGVSVSGAGDINGDGIDDLIIGATEADPNEINTAGASYVVFGSSDGFSADFDLATLDGSNGFVINGAAAYDRSGYSVSSAGDINGDGIDDLIIGASAADPNDNSFAGASYVVFGSQDGFSASLDLATLDGSNGFVINGVAENDRSGDSVSQVGDINGDDIDDLIIGAFGAEPNGRTTAGASYVVFGSETGFDASLDLETLDGSNGFVINGATSFDLSGDSVSGVGDINGDGIDDFIIGASGAARDGIRNAGASYVVFGSEIGFDASLNLFTLDGSNGFVINGLAGFNRLGNSVSGAGDVNGDGINDFIIGAYDANPDGTRGAGSSYVVFGSQDGFDATFDLATLDGSNGFAINGLQEEDRLGRSVSGAGDVNGDGIDDLIIGASSSDFGSGGSAGTSYVVFGRQTGFSANLDLATLDGSNGFVAIGEDEDDFSGISVSGAGDVNGDGVDDLIIGASAASPNGTSLAGTSYVVFGRSTPNLSIDDVQVEEGAGGTVATFTVSLSVVSTDVITVDITTADGTAIAGSDYTTTSGTLTFAPGETAITFTVDILDDALPEADETFGITLSNPTNAVLLDAEGIGTIQDDDEAVPTPGDDTLTGTDERDVISALAGNDTVNGLAGNDRLSGDAGDDQLFGNADNDQLFGGIGRDSLFGGIGADTLVGEDGNDQLFGAGGDDLMRGNLGADLLNGGANSDRLFGGAGRDRLTGLSGNDVLRGGADRDVLRGGAGNDRLVGEAGNDRIETGAGNDRIVIAQGQGLDRVTDFADGQDLIVLNNIQLGQLTIRQQENNVRISLGSEGLLLLENVSVGQISQTDFV